jgi:Spore germination B3/ GerAC like, C-terminal.
MKPTNGKKKAKLEGTAILKQGVLVGELDSGQTRGLLWITGKAKRGVSTVNTKWGQVVLFISHSSSKLKPVKLEGGSFRMELKVKEDCFLNTNETPVEMSSPEHIDMLKKLETEAILEDINNVYETAGSLSADIFGFGEAIRGDYPKEWDKIKDKWDEVFKTIELDVQTEVEIHSTGGLNKPIVPGGAEQK